jgi:hypothetical protein
MLILAAGFGHKQTFVAINGVVVESLLPELCRRSLGTVRLISW